MAFFESGSIALEAGILEKEVSGLALPFVPAQVVVSLRQPDADAPYITAVLCGTPTDDGFSASFSAPIPSAGYRLDWCACDGEAVTVDGESLAANYAELKGVVARFLGYDPEDLADTQAAEVDSCIQSGIRNFYYPPRMEGVDETYEWSFLRMACSVQTEPGVADYRMADGFGKVRGEIYFDGEDVRRRPIVVVPISTVLMRRGHVETGAPRCAAFSFKRTFGTKGQYVQMMLNPVPDRAYKLVFYGEADTGRISDEKPFPLGGPAFAELVTESCLASAEQRVNDEAGLHTENFRNLLISMIAKDRGRSGADYGFMGDRPDYVPPPTCRSSLMGGLKITYHGKTW